MTTTRDEGPIRLKRLWWLIPEWPLLLLGGGTMLAAYWQSERIYSLYNTAKYIQGSDVLLIAASIAAFALGRRLAAATDSTEPTQSIAADHIIANWFYLTTFLTAVGYAVWLGVGVRNGFRPGNLWELLVTDDPGVAMWLREELFPTIPGITTCTEFGVPAAILGSCLYFRGHRGVALPVLMILGMATIRSLFFSERTAIIVLAIPLFVLWLRMRVLGRRISTTWRWGLQLAPLLSVIILVLTFGGYEYFRSWRWYRQDFNSYAEFTAWRLSGYFTTAHNNGAMTLRVGRPREMPSYTLMPFWEFPLVKDSPFSYKSLTGIDPAEQYERMLENYGTLELVNRGGMFQPALDFGFATSLLFWCFYGFLAGRLYSSFMAGTLAGLTIFPLLYFTILEAPLELYLCYPRMLPPFVTLIAVVCSVWWFSADREHAATAPSTS
jgi:hypothetical protein